MLAVVRHLIALLKRPPTLMIPSRSTKGLNCFKSPFFTRLWRSFCTCLIQYTLALFNSSGVRVPSLSVSAVALTPSRFLRIFAPSLCIRAVTLINFRQHENFVQLITSCVVDSVQTAGVLRRSLFTSLLSAVVGTVCGHSSSGRLRTRVQISDAEVDFERIRLEIHRLLHSLLRGCVSIVLDRNCFESLLFLSTRTF